jgi:hypothetical protein
MPGRKMKTRPTCFNHYFSASHFSAVEIDLAGEPDLENVS